MNLRYQTNRAGAHGRRSPKRSGGDRAPIQILIGLLFLAHTLFYFFVLGTDAVDDAYISFRYAQNAIRGYGLVFNPAERVEGFTNFLWTAMMLTLEAAHIDVGRASMLLGALFALGTLWLVFRFAKIVDAPPEGARCSVLLLAALLLAADGSFALWAVGGLETAMFAFLIFAGAVFYVREQKWEADKRQVTQTQSVSLRAQRSNLAHRTNEIASSHPSLSSGSLLAMTNGFPLSGIFFALAAMTRPEGLLVFAITVAHQAAWRVLAERRLFAPRDLGRILAFSALFVPYWLGRWAYYHSFFPNSFYAKVSASGPAAQLERGWNHLAQFVNVHLGWLIVLFPMIAVVNAVKVSLRAPKGRSNLQPHPSQIVTGILGSSVLGLPPRDDLRHLPLLRGGKGRGEIASASFDSAALRSESLAMTCTFWTTYFAALVCVYSAYIVYVGGDWSVGRFFVPLLAPFYLLFSSGVVDLYEWFGARRALVGARRSVPLLAASVSFAALVFLFSSWNGEYGIFIRGFDAARATAARETMGKWLRANVPRGTLVAVDAAGQVPYFAELPAVDMFGINDLYIGRLQVETLGQGIPGHEKFDLGYVIGRAPTFVIIYGTLFDAVTEYERAPLVWTTDDTLNKFLTLYRRRTP